MYAVEFEAPIKDGVVRIPKEYKDLQDKRRVKLFIVYDDKDIEQVNTTKEKKMSAISIDTKGFKFNRDEAHER